MIQLTETPLTLAASLQRPRQIMMTLVSAGAHIDFRDKDGLTAMHIAARLGNRDAIRVRHFNILNTLIPKYT